MDKANIQKDFRRVICKVFFDKTEINLCSGKQVEEVQFLAFIENTQPNLFMD